MGAAADAALAAGGEAIGVIPEPLLALEQVHGDLTELHVVDSMHERKALMADLSDAFAALPGGIGTLEELLEIATWSKLGIHAKPVGVINVGGFYDPLAAMLDHTVEEGFMSAEDRRILLVDASPERLLSRLQEWMVDHGGPPRRTTRRGRGRPRAESRRRQARPAARRRASSSASASRHRWSAASG